MTDSHAKTVEQEYEEKNNLPSELRGLFPMLDGAARFLEVLPKLYSPEKVDDESRAEHKIWDTVGFWYLGNGRYHEALAIYEALYNQMLTAQEQFNRRCHKGTPLIRIADCYGGLGCIQFVRRYLMLTLIEDAIRDKGTISVERTGSYFRLVWGGLTDSEFKRYAREAFDLYSKDANNARFPEWVLQQLDQGWMTQLPAIAEAGIFVVNRKYVQYLMSTLGDSSGAKLELLADYIMSSMPGCRTMRRKRTPSTDYDLICSMEGLEVDFRSELGRYFVCECKDWEKPADFTTMAKFCRVLDSVKARFGILFSRHGISGAGQDRDAAREQLKVFQDRGMVIVVITEADLQRVSDGANFIGLLREKYAKVRLDLEGG